MGLILKEFGHRLNVTKVMPLWGGKRLVKGAVTSFGMEPIIHRLPN